MKLLKWLNVKVLSIHEAVQVLTGHAPMPERAALLTFDDGCVNFLEYALPVLEEFSYPSVVYAIAGMAGGEAAWLAADGHPTPPLMTYSQLREIKARGVEVGSHANSHVRLAELSFEAQFKELASSKDRLQQELGSDVMHACYPYGSYSMETMRAAQQAGYISAMTCERGAAVAGQDLLGLPRKAISYGDNALGFLWKLYFKNTPKQPLLQRV